MRYNALMTVLMTCAVAIPVQGNNHSGTGKIDEQKTDTALVIDEVEVISNSRKASALKIDVPAKYMPVSTNTIPSQTLQHRNITDIQTASRYLPGVRIRQTYILSWTLVLWRGLSLSRALSRFSMAHGCGWSAERGA